MVVNQFSKRCKQHTTHKTEECIAFANNFFVKRLSPVAEFKCQLKLKIVQKNLLLSRGVIDKEQVF